jgi:hypothetical protein
MYCKSTGKNPGSESMPSRLKIRLGVAALCFLLFASGRGRCQTSAPSEYQIKSAFIFNFAKFVEWPTNALNNDQAPIVIGVLGANPFGENLEKTINGKKVDAHPLVIKEIRSLSDAANCQILFICTSEKPKLRDILGNIKGASVLTIGEMENFTDNGGMINFVMEGTKIRFKINKEAASAAGLKLSGKLLALAMPSSK